MQVLPIKCAGFLKFPVRSCVCLPLNDAIKFPNVHYIAALTRGRTDNLTTKAINKKYVVVTYDLDLDSNLT